MAQYLFPDNSVIVSFGRAAELAALRAYLRGNGRVVEAVAREIIDSAGHVPQLNDLDPLDWFGKPLLIKGKRAIAQVEGIRIGVFGGSRSRPREHLGESQTLHLLRSNASYRDSVWLTEDREAYRFAQQQHILTRDIFGMLCEMVAYLDLSIERAYAIAQGVLDADRPMLRIPTSPRDFLM